MRAEITRPVEVARTLTRAGTPLGKAHEALGAIVEGRSPTVVIDERQLDQTLAVLSDLGVEAVRTKAAGRSVSGVEAPAL